MKVCIAEKPSVAREIANILGANTKRNKFDKGNNYSIKTRPILPRIVNNITSFGKIFRS
jgi:DNA topoisomerase IA